MFVVVRVARRKKKKKKKKLGIVGRTARDVRKRKWDGKDDINRSSKGRLQRYKCRRLKKQTKKNSTKWKILWQRKP